MTPTSARSLRILLASVGSRGDVQPMLALAQTLSARGHVPVIAAPPNHGGSGTMAQVLRAGVPQVILPLFLDQHHHAHRLFRANLIPRPVPVGRITAQGLADAIDAALALPPHLREAVAQRLRASDGRGAIVDRAEALFSSPA